MNSKKIISFDRFDFTPSAFVFFDHVFYFFFIHVDLFEIGFAKRFLRFEIPTF
jgi:hypothetical protein